MRFGFITKVPAQREKVRTASHEVAIVSLTKYPVKNAIMSLTNI